MNRILKIILIVFFVITSIFLIMAISGYRMIMGSMPVTEGELSVPELHSKVHIYRDGFHIPHILAENEHDLFFTQGYVTAQDRLWQMDIWRRYAKGQLSEVFGPFTTRTDSVMLTIGINRISKRIEPILSPVSKQVLKSYIDGINTFIKQNEKRLPVEFRLMNYQPKPWEITDCIAIMRFVGWQMSMGWSIDPVMGALVDKLGLEKAKDLFPFYADFSKLTQSEELEQEFACFNEFKDLFQSDGFIQPNFSSNCWVVSGNRSTTGKPILANDPHLAFFNPSFWYEMHLVGGNFHVSGFSIPGLPLIVVGYNEHIAWGVTNLCADDLDLYIEKLHPSDSVRYLHGRSYRSMEIIRETLRIREQPTVRMKIRKTHHGPVVSDILSHPLPDKAVSLCWAGKEISDEFLAFYHMNRATNWNAFREALKHLHIPSQNVLYADVKGNIGYQAAGKIPIRNNGLHFLPKTGQDPNNDWHGFIPFDQLPSTRNPKKGWLASANNPVKSEKYPHGTSDYFDLPYRINRIEQLLSEKPQFSIMDMKRIQGDVQSGYAVELLKQVLPYLNVSMLDDPVSKEVYKILAQWDGKMKSGSSEALIFEQFLIQCLKDLYKDELGDNLFTSWLDLYNIPLSSLLREAKKPHSSWSDNVATPKQNETMRELIHRSFQKTVNQISEKHGEEISNWSWGKVHKLTFKHPLGQLPMMDKIFNIGPFHLGGSGLTLNRMGFNPTKPFQIVWGTSGRLIIDLNNPDNCISVLPTGQSGQPMDDHYRDQVQLFIQNLYHSNLMDTTKIVDAGWECLTLKPEGKQ
jgi:penicillin amidase